MHYLSSIITLFIMKKSKKVQKPFFSKFLEAQQLDATTKIKGGINPVTMKAPSDQDEI